MASAAAVRRGVPSTVARYSSVRRSAPEHRIHYTFAVAQTAPLPGLDSGRD